MLYHLSTREVIYTHTHINIQTYTYIYAHIHIYINIQIYKHNGYYIKSFPFGTMCMDLECIILSEMRQIILHVVFCM